MLAKERRGEIGILLEQDISTLGLHAKWLD
jgi:hypothetical protein